MLLADIWRGMLQHPWDQADLVRCIHRHKCSRRATEVMKTHGFAELLESARAGDVVNLAAADRGRPLYEAQSPS